MEQLLPVIFCGVMGLAMLIYVILDGYDLGVGILLPLGNAEEKDIMIASIGPFWDANETWLVLGVGILLIAFPKAHGVILTSLYIPVTFMLLGLIVRGVAFDFRAKAQDAYKQLWNRLFFAGSLIAASAQGWMLGSYITGLEASNTNLFFSFLIAITLPTLYLMLGSAWLMMKTENNLLDKSVRWARMAFYPMGLGLLLVSIATPLVSQDIAAKWFSMPNLIALSPIPFMCLIFYGAIFYLLNLYKSHQRNFALAIFSLLIGICVLATIGLAYSIFPDIVMGKMSIWDAAASTGSLQLILAGTVVTLPLIILYTAYIYWIFRGKASNLSYS